MTSSPELLRFFVTEAGECLDTLEPLVANVLGANEGVEVVSTARALRGSATIARMSKVADIAFAIEQVGVAIRDGGLQWSPELQMSLRHAVDELRQLLVVIGRWGADQDARAAACEASVRRWVPNAGRPTPPMPASTTQPVFVALQAAAIAGDLDALLRAPDRRPILDQVLSRVRIMQGIAGLQEYPPLGDVCDVIERTARSLVPDAPLSTGETELFNAAAALLRRASDELRSREPSRPDRESPQVRRFADAVAALETTRPTPEHVVHIEELFYHDAGPHLVQRSGTPPMTPARRFADEVVSRAEHVKRLIADARSAGDGIARQRIRRDLASTLHALELTAQSFGAAQVAAFCHDAGRRADQLTPLELDALDAAASLLLSPTTSIDELERRVAVLTRRQHTPPAMPRQPTPQASPRVPTPAGGIRSATPAPSDRATARSATVTPTGRALQEMLANGIAGLSGLEQQSLAPGSEASSDDDIVPVESLLYRGRAALLRAIQVRDALRANATPDPESLRELYDLLDLARTE